MNSLSMLTIMGERWGQPCLVRGMNTSSTPWPTHNPMYIMWVTAAAPVLVESGPSQVTGGRGQHRRGEGI